MSPFKRYDIRGRLGIDLDEAVAHRIARAFATVTGAGAVVLARDSRESSPALAQAVAAGLIAQGVRVLDLGLAGTEEMYFATAHLGAGGGIMVTASHNPADYNGMKLVGPGRCAAGRRELRPGEGPFETPTRTVLPVAAMKMPAPRARPMWRMSRGWWVRSGRCGCW